MTKVKINPNKIKIRDQNMVKLINGATKTGVQTDRKKKEDKEKCRKPIDIPQE